MTKLLLVAFSASEAEAGTGFAATLGIPFDILNLAGRVDLDLGAENVLLADSPEVALADGLAKALSELASGYSHVASVSSMRSKDVLPRLAGILDAGMITDVIGIASPTSFTRPIVAGSILATVEVLSTPVMITFRPSGFPKPARSGESTVRSINLEAKSKAVRTNLASHTGMRPDLSQARVVVSGGRPLKDATTFETIIGGLADQLGGAVGATRAAVDSGIAPNELQVGQTGKIVAPDLYIAAGISGSTQHMAGIKDSKIIVAINKDPDAPIFESADFGLVADLYEAIPELRRLLA